MISTISVCLVAILKDENKFLDEWLVYHRMLGITHFFLYDDDPAQPLRNFLEAHADYITIINWWQLANKNMHRQGNQIAAYNHAVKNYLSPFEWVAFLDGDEFLVLRRHSTINEFLIDFKNEVSVSLNWHVFGHNGFYNDPTRLITSSLNRRKFMPFPDVKTITRTSAIAVIDHSHYCKLKYGERVDANRKPYTSELYEGKTDIAHVNHYLCRSFNNWMKRVDRGDVNFTTGLSANEEWRFEKERCLKRFVSIIAYDNNEYIDDFMLQYRYDIKERINQLRHNESPAIKTFLTPCQYATIHNQLKFIAELLVSKANYLDNIGLFSGKSGIAIFLFHYSRFTNDISLQQSAYKLLDDIADEITENSPVNCENGVAGYGIAIEHLVAKSFIKIDTDDLLENIDILINYHFIQLPASDKDFFSNIIEFGKYYISRFENPFNNFHHRREPKNRKILEEIFQIMNSHGIPSYSLINLLDFFCASYLHKDNRSETLESIQREVTKVKNIIAIDSDNAFKKSIFLPAIKILLNFSKKIEDDFYFNIADEMLRNYEDNYWQYINETKLSDKCKIDIGLHYLYIAKILNNSTFFEKGLYCLKNYIEHTDNNFFSENDISIKKIISHGLTLLAIISDWKERLFDLSLLFTTTQNED